MKIVILNIIRIHKIYKLDNKFIFILKTYG
jgi:hypothetical protein